MTDRIVGAALVATALLWLAAHYARRWWAAAFTLTLDERAETVEFTRAADEAIALTLPTVEPPVFDAMMRELPLCEAVYLMPDALGDEVESWLSGQAS